jgi:hypothetical protein
MTVPEYHIITSAMIVKPKTEPTFSEQATTVGIDDEAAGPFVFISQPTGPHGENKVAICRDEWPWIREAVEKMLMVCADEDKAERCHA